jgi:RNA polymerase sigma-70 factor, ECF subfamily
MGAETPWLELRERLRGFVARRVSNPADVDDIVQWVFLQMQRSLGRIRNGERIHAWLYSAARRAIVDHYRARARRWEVPSGDALDLDALPIAPGSRAGDADDERRRVAACLAPMVERLAPADRDAIDLIEVLGLRVVDAAARAGLSLSGMKSRAQRARVKLRKVMLACCHVALDRRGTPISCARRGHSSGDRCHGKPLHAESSR